MSAFSTAFWFIHIVVKPLPNITSTDVQTSHLPIDMAHTQSTRARLQALVQELIPLAEKYEEPAPGAFGIEDPLITKAKELIAQAQTPIDYATSLMVTTLEAISLRTLLQLNALQAIPPTAASRSPTSLQRVVCKTRSSSASSACQSTQTLSTRTRLQENTPTLISPKASPTPTPCPADSSPSSTTRVWEA